MFYVGQKVECINAKGYHEYLTHHNRFRPLIDNKKKVAFTIGADPESERWDNRRKVKERV